MKSSHQKRRSAQKSQSYQRLNIDHLLTSERSPHQSMIYDKMSNNLYQHSLSKKNRFLVELPNIYPIHKKLLNTKMKEIDFLKANDRRFHLRGYKFIKELELADDDMLEHQELQKSRISLKKKQSTSAIGNLFAELILKVNGVSHVNTMKNVKLKTYVEEGNNSRLIKQLLRKRVQIKLVADKNQADIVWTRFSDYASLDRRSKFAQKIQKHAVLQRSQDDYRQGFRKISQLQLDHLLQQQSKSIQLQSVFIHNHLKNHEEISDKKNLFKNIRAYCQKSGIDEGTLIPKTFHISCSKFKDQNLEIEKKVDEIFTDKKFNDGSFFVVKPGEDTNRGEGISVVKGKQSIVQAIKQLNKKGKSSLVQQYIAPLLYRNRKFDIRCYVLITSVFGQFHAYWYKQGYLRTCVKQFNYDPSNIFGHLTNDAIQKKHKDYGKFQQANKLSFNDLEVILGQTQRNRDQVIKDMKNLARHSIKAVEQKLKGEKNLLGFEIFGYDFLIDKDGKVWLIQVNTNPCLQFSGSLLSRIIWHMVDNSMKIALDPFLEPDIRKQYQNYLDLNKYQCII